MGEMEHYGYRSFLAKKGKMKTPCGAFKDCQNLFWVYVAIGYGFDSMVAKIAWNIMVFKGHLENYGSLGASEGWGKSYMVFEVCWHSWFISLGCISCFGL